MATTVSGLTVVEPSADGETVKLVFPKKSGNPLEVILSLEQLALAIPDLKRAAEIRTQKMTAQASGIEAVAFSIVKEIVPRPDMVLGRMYLQLDPGTPYEIVYAMSLLKAAKLGLDIYSSGEEWLKSHAPSPGEKQ